MKKIWFLALKMGDGLVHEFDYFTGKYGNSIGWVGAMQLDGNKNLHSSKSITDLKLHCSGDPNTHIMDYSTVLKN